MKSVGKHVQVMNVDNLFHSSRENENLWNGEENAQKKSMLPLRYVDF